jgi:hypothetical protein
MSTWLTDTPLGARISIGRVAEERLGALLRSVGAESGAALLESSRPGRWIVGVARGTELLVVAKLASGLDEGLAIEANSLRRALRGRSWRMPAILQDYTTPGTLAMSWQPGVCEMDPGPVLNICRDLQASTVIHGDLTAWNLLRTHQDEHVLLDWETARWCTLKPGHDLIHYHTKRALLLDGKPADVLVTELLSPEGWLAQLLATLEVTCEAALLAYIADLHPGDTLRPALEYRRAMLDAVRARAPRPAARKRRPLKPSKSL